MKLTLLPEPTFPAGPTRVRVGTREYSAPRGAGIAVSEAGEGLTYLLVHSRIHAVTQAGEVQIPDDLRQRVASRYFGNGRTR